MYGVFQPQPTMANPTIEMTGGYPGGYPPAMPQANPYSPFTSPFPNPQPPVGGMPIEVTMNNGSTMNIPASTGFNPGGATVQQGGFNPVTGVSTPAMGGPGFNPYAVAPMLNGMGANPYLNQQMAQQQGIRVYDPSMKGQYAPPMGMYGVYSPMMGGFYNPNGQNQFNNQIQEFLYEEDCSSMDAVAMLERTVLTDEEREKINHKQNYIIGRDYYGRPIYNNAMGAFQANNQRQQEFEEARRHYQEHFTNLSKIAHGYDHEDIDVDATMKRFDPVPPQPQAQSKIFNYATATDSERKDYEADMAVMNSVALESRFTQAEQMQRNVDMQKQQAFAQIKASHDKMIGVEPGEHYDLKTFMDNGYKIRVNIAQQKAKSLNRNGTNKYSRSDFRANLSQATNSPVPVTSKDDEYVSIEEMLKGIYDRNKRVDSVLRSQNGHTVFGAAPTTPQFDSERQAHQYFLQAMQQKKDIDDVKRSVG